MNRFAQLLRRSFPRTGTIGPIRRRPSRRPGLDGISLEMARYAAKVATSLAEGRPLGGLDSTRDVSKVSRAPKAGQRVRCDSGVAMRTRVLQKILENLSRLLFKMI